MGRGWVWLGSCGTFQLGTNAPAAMGHSFLVPPPEAPGLPLTRHHHGTETTLRLSSEIPGTENHEIIKV